MFISNITAEVRAGGMGVSYPQEFIKAGLSVTLRSWSVNI